MQVMLRTASTLARACAQAITKLEIAATSRVSVLVIEYVDQPVDTYLRERSRKTSDNLDQALLLLEAQMTIRRLIGDANSPNVDALLTERILLDATEKQLDTVISKPSRRGYEERSVVRVQHAVKEVQVAVQAMRERLISSTSDGPDTIEVPNLADDHVRQIERRIEGIRRRRIEVSDLLARENLTKMITLPDNVVATLRRHGIVASESR